MFKRLASLATAMAIAVLSIGSLAADQPDYPNKPIRIVVPYPPGGTTDISVRAFVPELTEMLGQPIVVEHRPGAGTNLGAEIVARSEPDGYTLYVSNFASHGVNRWLFSKLPFDPATDFTPVAMLVRGPMFLCLRPGFEVKSAADLVELARKKPGGLTYSSSGNGSPPHIAGELLKYLTKIDVLHVPYKGSAAQHAALLAGEVDFGFDGSIIALHRSNRLRCIAVGSTFRWPTDKEIPTLIEAGISGFDVTSFFGIVGPKGMPQPIVEKLNAAFRKAAERSEVGKRLEVSGTIPFPATVEETRAFLREQDTKWGPIVKASGAKVD